MQVTLTGFWTATGGSSRVVVVDLDSGTAVEWKSRRGSTKKFQSKITNPARLAKLIEQAKKKAAA